MTWQITSRDNHIFILDMNGKDVAEVLPDVSDIATLNRAALIASAHEIRAERDELLGVLDSIAALAPYNDNGGWPEELPYGIQVLNRIGKQARETLSKIRGKG